MKTDEDILKGKDHEHEYYASQCEEGCGCDYLHLGCKDTDCTFYAIADGWKDCNVDWEYRIKELKNES